MKLKKREIQSESLPWDYYSHSKSHKSHTDIIIDMELWLQNVVREKHAVTIPMEMTPVVVI